VYVSNEITSRLVISVFLVGLKAERPGLPAIAVMLETNVEVPVRVRPVTISDEAPSAALCIP
jgi:hypothetical protein